MSAIAAPTAHADPGRKGRTAVLLLLGADIVFVVCLFFAYFYLRALDVEGMWMPKGVHAPADWQAWLLAVLLLASSAAYRAGTRGIAAGARRRLQAGLALALALLVGELAFAVWQLASLGFGAASGAFASAFLVLSGYHVLHLLLGLTLGLGLANRAVRVRDAAQLAYHTELLGYFWYWVTAMAVAMALAMLVH